MTFEEILEQRYKETQRRAKLFWEAHHLCMEIINQQGVSPLVKKLWARRKRRKLAFYQAFFNLGEKEKSSG